MAQSRTIRALLPAVLFMVGIATLGAQQVVVDYAEGMVDARAGSGWEPVYIGQRLEPTAAVRIGASGYAELSEGSATVRLTRPGSYLLETVLEGVERNRRVGLGSMMRTRLERIGGTQQQDESAVAGVRGNDAGAAELMWVGGEEAGELIQEGIELLADGTYGPARERFSEAYDFAESDAQAARARFYIGYTDYLEGNLREALEAFSDVELERGDRDYDTWVLTRAQALVESFAYEESLAVLSPYIENADPAPESAQTALILRGIAYEGLGRTPEARADLTAARETAPDGERAQMIRRLLAEL
jgi:tetratricopeptide (TPR) repeat protein